MAGKCREIRSYGAGFLWKEHFRDLLPQCFSTARPAYAEELTSRAEQVQTSEPSLEKESSTIPLSNTKDLKTEHSPFVALLKVCAKSKDLCRGTRVHADLLKKGLLEKSSHVMDALVSMYAKCGALTKAKGLLYGLPVRDVFSWTALIAGYAHHGHGQDALHSLEQMQSEGVSPDAVTFACILKACGSIGATAKGEQIHNEIAKQGLLGNDIVLGNALVDMYVKCGCLAKAQEVLEELPSRNVVTWNALIAGYAQHGHGHNSLMCFERMQREGHFPDAVTFACILKACGSIGAVNKGEQIHDEIARQGLLGKDMVLDNALVDMYAKCGALAKAQEVLNQFPVRNVVSWSALIAGYVERGHSQDALNCFERMQREGLSPDAVTLPSILKACGAVGAIDKGERIHDEIRRQGLLENNVVLGNALLDMYAKCGALEKAHQVLKVLPSRNVVTWNALIAGYAQHGRGQDALNCFKMMHHEGLSPNAVTYACILTACGSVGEDEKGEQIHNEITRQGLLKNNVFLGNALVDMYAKCGVLEKAEHMLRDLSQRDVVSWNALIAGYAQQGQGEEALKCFEQLQHEGLVPNAVTFACTLTACGSMGAVIKGEQIHEEIKKQGLLENNLVLGTALVDMYAKCGALGKAQKVLEELLSDDVVPWNALLGGYAQQGHCEDAFNCFEQMQCKGVSPDAVTFSSMLHACSHSGRVDEGQSYFAKMSTTFGIEPGLEHYSCMVDLLGRAGHLDKAVALIEEMPSSDYSEIWSALLGACRKWGDITIGRWAFEHAIQIDKSDAAAYVLMFNIYAAAGMQEDAENIEAMRMRNKACKKLRNSLWFD